MEAQAGRPTKWEIEVGEDNTAAAAGGGDMLIAASSDQPVVTRLDTKEGFQVRLSMGVLSAVRCLVFPEGLKNPEPMSNETVGLRTPEVSRV